jgi:alpha/beta superfamily hydrolase
LIEKCFYHNREITIMKIPTQTRPFIWGVAAGAIALAILGFTWGGWVTGGAAEQMAKNEANIAVVKVLAPICVDKFQQQPDAATVLTKLRATSSYQQAAFVADGGWATLPGSDKPHSGTAKACADLLSKLPQ